MELNGFIFYSNIVVLTISEVGWIREAVVGLAALFGGTTSGLSGEVAAAVFARAAASGHRGAGHHGGHGSLWIESHLHRGRNLVGSIQIIMV